MNVIINIPDGLATELISTAKQNGEDIEAHITKVLSEYIWPEEARSISDDAGDHSTEKESEEVVKENAAPVQEKPAPLTNDTTAVFGTNPNPKEKGAPLYCKKETNSWKIL